MGHVLGPVGLKHCTFYNHYGLYLNTYYFVMLIELAVIYQIVFHFVEAISNRVDL